MTLAVSGLRISQARPSSRKNREVADRQQTKGGVADGRNEREEKGGSNEDVHRSLNLPFGSTSFFLNMMLPQSRMSRRTRAKATSSRRLKKPKYTISRVSVTTCSVRRFLSVVHMENHIKQVRNAEFFD